LLDAVPTRHAGRKLVHEPVERGNVRLPGVQEGNHAGIREEIQVAKS